MPKYRKLWVKATESHDINEMPDDLTRLLWVLLPLGLDCEGRGQDNTAWIKAKIMPLREDVTHAQVTQAMTWYANRGMIERYEVNGRRYFWVPTFAHYQGNTDKEAESEYPAPPQSSSVDDTRPVQTDSGVGLELVTSKSVSDADADAYTDSDAESSSIAADAATTPPKPKQQEPNTPVERHVMALWNAKRLNSSQQELLAAFDREYAYERIVEVSKWCHTEGMKLGHALNAMKTALKNWDKPKSGGRSGNNRGDHQAGGREPYRVATERGTAGERPPCFTEEEWQRILAEDTPT